jgi:protease IV
MKKYPFLQGFLLMFLIGLMAMLGTWLITAKKPFAGFPLTGKGKIAVIEVEGVITKSRDIIKTLTEYKDNPNIRAIIVRIDSPGGGVGPSQEIYAELLKQKDKKLLIASMGSVAASGGYYIACATDTIFANPGTITGSIGVIIEFANIEELIGKIGLKSVVIKSGKYKDILSPTRELKNDEKAIIQSVIDSIHGQFIDAVARGRHMPRKKVADIADGRIFSGEQAKAQGLVDELGTLQDAIDFAALRTGLNADSDVIRPDKKRTSVFDYIIDESISKITEILFRNRMSAQFIVPN